MAWSLGRPAVCSSDGVLEVRGHSAGLLRMGGSPLLWHCTKVVGPQSNQYISNLRCAPIVADQPSGYAVGARHGVYITSGVHKSRQSLTSTTDEVLKNWPRMPARIRILSPRQALVQGGTWRCRFAVSVFRCVLRTGNFCRINPAGSMRKGVAAPTSLRIIRPR